MPGKDADLPKGPPLQIQRCSVRWLVQSNLSAAWQLHGCLNSPAFLTDLRTLYLLGFQCLDGGLQVVAHQVEHRTEQSMPCMNFPGLPVRRMHGNLGRRQLKNQPASPYIHRAKSQSIPKKGAIRSVDVGGGGQIFKLPPAE